MGKRLQAIKERVGLPSGRAIIHVVVVEIIINAIWNRVSIMFTIPLIREIGFLVLIVAVLFVVAWYLPKLSPILSGATKASQEVTQEMIVKEYPLQVIESIGLLIKCGEELTERMGRPDFHVGQLGQEVRQWLDTTEHEVWEVVSEHASQLKSNQTTTKEVFTAQETLRYGDWDRNAASLRVSVDRRLTSLREIRSQIQIADTKTECKEALKHVIIESRNNFGLQVHAGRPGHPVMYPISLRNTRPEVIDIVGWNVSILWDVESIDNVTWRPPNRDASNGLAVHAPFDSPEPWYSFRIQPDSPYRLEIPVNMSKVSVLPPQSPAWTARGTIYFKCGNENSEQQFNFTTDNYKLSDEQWGWYKTNKIKD